MPFYKLFGKVRFLRPYKQRLLRNKTGKKLLFFQEVPLKFFAWIGPVAK